MADVRTLLAQILGREEEEPPNLAPRAPATQANTRGIFGRRPTGRPDLSLPAVNPMVTGLIPNEREPQAPHPFPFPMAGEPPLAPSLRLQQPQAARVRPMGPEHPGSYANFADYVDGRRPQRRGPHLRREEFDQEPWRQPVSTERWAAGSPSTGRGIEPPNAPAGPSETSMENDAWNAALTRTQQIMGVERRHRDQRLPRPGRPLIAQAWAEPNEGNLLGGLVGLQGRDRPTRATRRDRR